MNKKQYIEPAVQAMELGVPVLSITENISGGGTPSNPSSHPAPKGDKVF